MKIEIEIILKKLDDLEEIKSLIWDMNGYGSVRTAKLYIQPSECVVDLLTGSAVDVDLALEPRA